MQDLVVQAHPQWHTILKSALKTVDHNYITSLQTRADLCPPISSLLAAFSLPLTATRYIFFGESPYPRSYSANGYAFWDANVGALWSSTGFSKELNRATSLRNFIKMLLVARGDLNTDLSQAAIARLDKSNYQKTAQELFTNFIAQGFLLLNASLVYYKAELNYHALHWQPFIYSLLSQLSLYSPDLKLVLLGRIAKHLPRSFLSCALVAEHPYNISFITNPEVIGFFQPLDILLK